MIKLRKETGTLARVMMHRFSLEEMKDFENHNKKIKCELYRDSMQNYKKYAIPPAQLIIADVPYNVGNNFYGSNPMWYNGGDNKNGESKLAGKEAFNSDFNFNLYEYFHFCSKMLKKDDTKPVQRGRSSNSPCMIVFCSFEQIHTLIKAAEKHGFIHYIPLVFCKNYSPQVLKITILGNEYVILDIFLRMLTPEELKLAQGFPADYIIDRDCNWQKYPASEQVKRIGNSVVPIMAEALVKANCPYLRIGERQPTPMIYLQQNGQMAFG